MFGSPVEMRVAMRHAVPIVCVVLLLGCGGLMPPARTTAAKSTTVEVTDPRQSAILAALRKCVDPEGMEVVTWGQYQAESKQMHFRLRFRAEAGGKRTSDWIAFFKDDRVDRLLDTNHGKYEWHHVPN